MVTWDKLTRSQGGQRRRLARGGITATRAVLGAATAAVIAAAGCAAAGCSHASSRPPGAAAKPWALTTPKTAGGLARDLAAEDSGQYDSFRPVISGMNAKIKPVGHATASVFGIYDLQRAKPNQLAPLVILAGANGTFRPQAMVQRVNSEMPPGIFHVVPPGPHGGYAICGSQGTGAAAADACVWATATTYGTLIVDGNDTKAVTSMPDLMIRMRNDLEVASP